MKPRKRLGRPSRDDVPAEKRISIRVTHAEYKLWRRAAVGQTLSSWLRGLANKNIREWDPE